MKAHNFELESPEGKVKLSDDKGRWVALYFYPKDDTPGCTIEAKDFTRLAKEFEERNAVILGVSIDTCESHTSFSRKHGLNVRLLSDPDAKVQKLYGAWGDKVVNGRPMVGTLRTTFLIDPQGSIAKEWRNVKAEGHAQDVLDALDGMK